MVTWTNGPMEDGSSRHKKQRTSQNLRAAVPVRSAYKTLYNHSITMYTVTNIPSYRSCIPIYQGVYPGYTRKLTPTASVKALWNGPCTFFPTENQLHDALRPQT